MIKEIMEAVTIPVFAKVRIGHFVEAQILESIGVDMIDESEGMNVDSCNTYLNINAELFALAFAKFEGSGKHIYIFVNIGYVR